MNKEKKGIKKTIANLILQLTRYQTIFSVKWERVSSKSWRRNYFLVEEGSGEISIGIILMI